MKIKIVKISITDIESDAIVNAANINLWQGGGVCGAIFRTAGAYELNQACEKIGGCPTGKAVITPGFKSKAKYIIHAVGPIYQDGNYNEREYLYSAYISSLDLCIENEIHSIAFPLISAGIYGYPLKEAWEVAIQACKDWINNHEYPIEITFCILDDRIIKVGKEIL